MMDGEAPDTLDAADAALTTSVEPSEAPAAEPEGQPRDEQGRFASPSEPEAEAPVEEAPAEETEVPVEPEAAAEGEEAEAEEPDEPIVYRADGQEFEIPGSAVGDDGWFIPADQIPEVQQLLASGKAFSGSYRQRLSEAAQQVEAARQETAAANAQSQHVLAHFEGLIERSQEAIRAGTMEALLASPLGQWFLSVGQGWPILKADARTKALELASQQATKRLQEYERNEHQARIRPLMSQTVQESVWQQGQAMGLDRGTLDAVQQMLVGPGYERLLFVPAPYDDPAGAYRKGDTVIDHTVVAGALQLAAINRGRADQQERIAQAQRNNAAAATRTKAPPTVGAKGRTPSGAVIPQPKSAAEADAMLLDGDLSWAEELER